MESVTNLSKAYNLNLQARRNDTFTTTITVKENGSVVDLSSYTSAKMQLKETELSDSVATFANTGTSYNINISNLSIGEIAVSASTLQVLPNTYIYDLELRNSTQTETIVYGKFYVVDDVTK